MSAMLGGTALDQAAEAAPGRLRQLLRVADHRSDRAEYAGLSDHGDGKAAASSPSIWNFCCNWGANAGALTSGGQWWRLLTSTFEHGGLLHIALNMWCLYNLGWLAELLFGRSRFTLLYLMCGIGGSLGSICWRGNGISVGASGAIFGIAGALIPAMMLHSNQRLRAHAQRTSHQHRALRRLQSCVRSRPSEAPTTPRTLADC